MVVRSRSWLVGVGFGLIAAVAVAGCAATKYPVVSVSGKAQFSDGTPLPHGTRILLNPAEGNVGTASAVTGPDGTFTLTHVSGQSGAEAGTYIVVLQPPVGGNINEFSRLIPKDYGDGSRLTAEIKEGMGPLEIKIPRNKK